MLVVLIGVVAAEQKKTPVKAGSAKAATKAETEIPPGAKEIEPNIYRHTDARGKTWRYRRTPFGIMKAEEKPEPQTAVEQDAGFTVEEDGEIIRFSKTTPFGLTRWSKKKTELTETEREAWERSKKPKGKP